MTTLLRMLLLGLPLAVPPAGAAQAVREAPQADRARPAAVKKVPKRQVGKASIYANRFAGRRMANGRPMDPRDDNAASKTLPLGTRALVRNLETGKSAVVTIEDRGPFVPGRVVDLSPATAQQIGLSRKEGVAPVEVIPLEVPAPGRKAASS